MVVARFAAAIATILPALGEKHRALENDNEINARRRQRLHRTI